MPALIKPDLMSRLARGVAARIERFNGWIVLARATAVERGQRVRAGPGLRMRVTDGGRCRLGDDVAFDRGVDVTVKCGTLEIGARSYVGQGSVIVARDRIDVGSDCLIAEYVTIRDQDHAIAPGQITAQNGFVTAPIAIGNNVWIGAKATITKGTTIGDNAIVGAGAVVTHDVPADCVVAGVPARVLRKI